MGNRGVASYLIIVCRQLRLNSYPSRTISRKIKKYARQRSVSSPQETHRNFKGGAFVGAWLVTYDIDMVTQTK